MSTFEIGDYTVTLYEDVKNVDIVDMYTAKCEDFKMGETLYFSFSMNPLSPQGVNMAVENPLPSYFEDFCIVVAYIPPDIITALSRRLVKSEYGTD